MRCIDPIAVMPRFEKRDWGRSDLGQWGPARGPAASDMIAEAWLYDAANGTDSGPLGRRLAANVHGMLGDLGRAPPRVRIIFPGRTTPVSSTAPLSLWTVLEPGDPAGEPDAFHRPGDRIRAYDGATVVFAGGSVALEISAGFLPANDHVDGPLVVRLPPVSSRRRATLFRDAAFSVESWMLPEWSRIVPDGETCHVLTALTPGVAVDGGKLPPGQAIFIPAWGRPLDVTAADRGAKAIVAYPDARPTSVWRHTPSPDPAGARLPKPQPWRPRAADALAYPQPAMAA
jgi:hypothetical protein